MASRSIDCAGTIFAIALLSCLKLAIADSPGDELLPQDFNPHTCEKDRVDPKNAYVTAYRFHSCNALRLGYQLEANRRSILEATNLVPHAGSKPSDPDVLAKLKSSLLTLEDGARRFSNDYVKPEGEFRDVLGAYLDESRRQFAVRNWDVPSTVPDVFRKLSVRLAKQYVEPDEFESILHLASERGLALYSRVAEATRAMVVDVDVRVQAKETQEFRKAQAAELAEHFSYLGQVRYRAKEFRGLWNMFIGSAFLAALAVFMTRQANPSARGRIIAFTAGTVGLFVAMLFAGSIRVITGIPTTGAFVILFMVFGIAYVMLRDRLHEQFPALAALATHGSASWSSIADATQAGRLFERGLVSADSFGFALGRMGSAPDNLDPRLRYMGHVLTCAPTGSGKGVGAVIPTLLEYPGSAIVFDIKGENHAVTARTRRAIGHAIHVVDPFGVTPASASCFNPLDAFDAASPDLVGQIAALIDSLVIVSGDQNDNSAHFNDSAKELIKGLVAYVLGHSPEKRNLAEVRRLLTLPLFSRGDGQEALTDHLAEMTANPSAAFGIAARSANGFLSKDPKEASGVHSTALRHTAFLDDPRIAATLSRSDFRFADIKKTAMTIYLVMPPDRIAAQSRFMRTLVGSALSAITATSDKPPLNVLFLLDEFAQLGRLSAIEDAISLVRGYGARFWLFVQDLSQLKGVYPKWQTFLANSAKQFYGTADFETARYISDMLGQATVEFRTVGDSSSTSLQGGGSSGSSTNQQLTARALLTPDEVMRQGSLRPIVLIQGERPYRLERIDYRTDPEYAGLSDPNPFHG